MKLKYFITLAVISMAACARAPVEPTEPPTREELQNQAVEESPTKHVYRARYNPPLCPCPAFEVAVGDRWVRVALVDQDEDRPLRGDLSAFAEEQGSVEQQALYLIGTLEPDRIQNSATGFPVMEFVLEGFTDSFPVSSAPRGEIGEQE